MPATSSRISASSSTIRISDAIVFAIIDRRRVNVPLQIASVLRSDRMLKIGDCSVPTRTIPLVLKGRDARAVGHTAIVVDVFGGLEFDCLVAFLGKECLPLWDGLCCEVA
jgi:hypothetical protein